eukprot:7391693-Prymnesium_polylepis.1
MCCSAVAAPEALRCAVCRFVRPASTKFAAPERCCMACACGCRGTALVVASTAGCPLWSRRVV